MKGLREKFRKNEGFTLVEMLIVVAIIAILIAVSIPLVSNSLDKARHATDQANERAAKAELMIQYLAGDDAVIDGVKGEVVINTNYWYDAADGKLLSSRPSPLNGYGQCKRHSHDGKIIAMQINAVGEIKMAWTKDAGADDNSSSLCSGRDLT